MVVRTMSSSKYVVAKQVDFGRWEYLQQGCFIPELSWFVIGDPHKWALMVSFSSSIESAAKFTEEKAHKVAKVLHYRTDDYYRVERYASQQRFA